MCSDLGGESVAVSDAVGNTVRSLLSTASHTVLFCFTLQGDFTTNFFAFRHRSSTARLGCAGTSF
jgi:hypothetical protein